ncbi:MAG: ligase-associated DNA damage response DEXH box helicase [Bacteroidetes bacterium]|nr:MAG: ligase-associated DNA damage response DEXH box helicase [Bacteroidota bacterium]
MENIQYNSSGVGQNVVETWLTRKGITPFLFQQQAWQCMLERKSGLVNAPTGCGKTFAVFLGAVIVYINDNPENWRSQRNNGLRLIWITPLRALAKDIGRAMEEALGELGLPWKVGIRNGDTTTGERAKQKRSMPEILIITPESFHLLLATKQNHQLFERLSTIAVDEWHELMGSKRGVQTELAIAYVAYIKRQQAYGSVQVWGISATIGNLEEAGDVLMAPIFAFSNAQTTTQTTIVKASIDKKIAVHAIIPDEITNYPWAGHLGIKLAHKIVPIIEASQTTLVFINTRGMAERWYQTLLDVAPQLAGALALHHGSIEQELRLWVEDALHTEQLKAVVCTASLDLGVDFRPVNTVIQVGSPKGVSRFLQRAGRAGHQPGAVSNIYFLPTHALELAEVAALKQAIADNAIEQRPPLCLCFDVLIQFMCTIAVGEGFAASELWTVAKATHCFSQMTAEEYDQLLLHITQGGKALQQYNEYQKVEVTNGFYSIKNRRVALRHRMNIGTIVSDAMLKVKFIGGGFIGHIEEYFISKLEAGDVFTLAGKTVELVQLKDMTVLVRKSKSKKSLVPSWMGGRMSLTANLGEVLRHTFDRIAAMVSENAVETNAPIELVCLKPLFQLQQALSHIPTHTQLLIEHIEDHDGFHLLVYPFEGRQVHEAMSAILAYRIGLQQAITFSISMNDYGFELLSDQPIHVDDSNVYELFSTHQLLAHINKSINSVEMASRKFRDIAVIGGLIFQGMPGEQKKARHLQSSSSLLFKVLSEYEPDNILLRQAYNEVFEQQMEEARLRAAFERIQGQTIIVSYPKQLTPMSFPIVADGLNRNNLSSEQLDDRIKRMQKNLMG